MKKTIFVLAVLAALVLCLSLLAGCGGGDGGDSETNGDAISGDGADSATTESADNGADGDAVPAGGGDSATTDSADSGDGGGDGDAAPAGGGGADISYEMDSVNVSVVLPSSDWIDNGRYGSAGSYSVIWYYKDDYSNSPRISLEIKSDTSSFDKRYEDGDNRKDIANRTIGGVDMKGRAFDLYGMEWIEYVGKVNADNFVSIRISRVDIESGEGKAVLDSIKFN